MYSGLNVFYDCIVLNCIQAQHLSSTEILIIQQKKYFVAVLHRFYVSHCVMLSLISNNNNNSIFLKRLSM